MHIVDQQTKSKHQVLIFFREQKFNLIEDKLEEAILKNWQKLVFNQIKFLFSEQYLDLV